MSVLERLRNKAYDYKFEKDCQNAAFGEFTRSGVKFVCDGGDLQNIYDLAVRDLMRCVANSPNGTPMLIEGSEYIGCWLESTGTISTEILSRFCPDTAKSSFGQFAAFKREDGLLPYKVTDAGAAFRQIQTVTPLARSVYNAYKLNGDKAFLRRMYDAMAENDAWLAKYRDTRGTGCVEAFCTFDTGHDASPRFWHAPDTCADFNPARYDADSPVLPFLAPDLTANVYCQREYLAKIAEELGLDGREWREKALKSLKALANNCYCPEDGFFYDVDRNGKFVKVQGDALMRVFACEVGVGEMFKEACERYFLNTRKFFSRYPFTVIALDDPRYSQDINHNSWAGGVSFLAEIRVPHAFEINGRFTELTWVIHPILTALSRFKRFHCDIDPWLGAGGFSDNYSPTMLCVLDFIERICGIYPTPNGELLFTGVVPKGIDYGRILATETAYSRIFPLVDGARFELVCATGYATVYKNGAELFNVPQGVRVVTDRTGDVKQIIGMTIRRVEGALKIGGKEIPFGVNGNEVLNFDGTGFKSVSDIGVITPEY